MIHIYHIIILSPLLMYIGYNKILYKSNNSYIIILLINLIFGFIYHITRYINKEDKDSNNKKKINIYHIISIIILLYYTIYNNTNIYYKSL